jgi:nitrogen fixation protein NifQ
MRAATLSIGDDRLRLALAGVLDTARAGHLPPFALTLGLPAAELADIVAGVMDCVPDAATRYAPPPDHEGLLAQTPPLLGDLVALMLDHRSGGADPAHARWLAHAIATASFGGRHLWQDLGVDGRATVSLLMLTYFQPLHDRNTSNLKWKRFLYGQLGERLGTPGLRAAGCAHCDHFQQCFP